jgi:DNA-3-methyladenine glycosylase II
MSRPRIAEDTGMTATDGFSARHTLTATAPFDFDASLRFVSQFSPTSGEQHIEDGVLTKALRAGGATVLVRVSATGSGGGVAVEMRCDGQLSAAVAAATLDRVGFYLSLDDDLTEFYATAAGDAAFHPVTHRLHGYHQVKFSSPWENVAWAILAQRCPMAVAARAKAALTEACGNVTEWAGRTYGAFPDAAQLATCTPADLVSCLGNERKAAYLLGSAQRWLTLSEDELRHGPYEQVREQLLGLPGIGPWSSTFVLIRGLGRMEEAPPDKELLRAAARVYGIDIDAEGLARLATRYGPWQGYWAHYLRAGG